MSNAIKMYATGGPEVLTWEPYDPGPPGPGEARVVHEAIGLNFIDVYQRSGLYPLPSLPAIPGLEGAGRVEAIGEGVSEVAVGDRVAYAGVPPGAYAEVRRIPAHRLVRLPEAISCRDGAALMLQGMTARYLIKGCFPVGAGTTLLIHAAAGGVGSLLCQWAAHLGARVIGTVGSRDKAQLALANGCHHPILYNDEDFVARVKELTKGQGVDVVYDSIGATTFMQSLDCLRPMGTMVAFGQASGPIEPFNIGLLAQKGSLFLTRPSLMHYTARRDDLLAHAEDLFAVVTSGVVKSRITGEYPLRDAARAHADLEARRTTGSCILLP